jgi:hypothetical protein
LSQKWFYPFILCGLVALGYGVILFGIEGGLKGWDRLSDAFQGLVFVGLGIWVCVMISWTTWTDRVDVGDQGVRWKDGKDKGFLRWEDVSSLVLDGTSLGPVQRNSGKSVKLPFAGRKLLCGAGRAVEAPHAGGGGDPVPPSTRIFSYTSLTRAA